MVIADEKKGSQSPSSEDRSSRSCIRNASVHLLALGSVSGFDTSDQISCTIERIVALALSIGMGLTADFNDVEWGTDDYSSCSRDVTIGPVSARERVSWGGGTNPAQKSAIGGLLIARSCVERFRTESEMRLWSPKLGTVCSSRLAWIMTATASERGHDLDEIMYGFTPPPKSPYESIRY